MFKKAFAIIVLQLLAMIASADPTHDELKIVFKTTNDADLFSKHYKLNTLDSYFQELGVSEPSYMNRNIYQAHFLDNFKRDNKTVFITIADEIFYYGLESKVSLTEQLIQWSEKSQVNLRYNSCGHFGSCGYFTIANGQNHYERETGILEGVPPSFECNTGLSDTESFICNSRQLSLLDNLMSKQYALLIASHSDKIASKLKEEQVAWLSKRNACSNFSCIKALYKNRLSIMMNPYLSSEGLHEFHVILSGNRSNRIGLTYSRKNKIPSWLLSRVNSKDDDAIIRLEIYSLPAECRSFFYELELSNYSKQLSNSREVKGLQYLEKICQ